MDKVEIVIKMIKKKREEKNLRLEDVADMLGKQGVDITISGLHRIEKGGRQKLDSSLLVGLSNILNYNFFELLGWNPPKESDSFHILEAEKITLKAYNYDSNRDGRVDLKNYTEVNLMISEKDCKQFENSFVINVIGNAMQPYFFEKDILAIEKDEFISWEELDRKIILYKYKDILYIRKVFFQEGKGYLVAFNNRVYADFEINKEVEYLGKMVKQVNIRDLSTIQF